MHIIDLGGLDRLIAVLAEQDYVVIGPVLRDGAIVYDTLQCADDLPIGWTDRQEAGEYRVTRRDDQARFGYAVGPHSWKRYLFPPEVTLWQLRRDRNGFAACLPAHETPRYAFLGVRSCELHAMAIQDRVFLPETPTTTDRATLDRTTLGDPIYAARRSGAFIVVVQCTAPGNTCFCASMNTGPTAERGFDLALTEVIAGDIHHFVVAVASERGEKVLDEVPHRAASEDEILSASQAQARAARQMGRTLDTTDIKNLFHDNQDHPVWNAVAERCLACASCTLVCPTCFCSTVTDSSSHDGAVAERRRQWDSCFHSEFSYLHGGNVRQTIRSRYRQWLTHKLASWIDQFGSSGCVGCGRCITWCPVAIDLTEEVGVIRQSERRVPPPKKEVL